MLKRVLIAACAVFAMLGVSVPMAHAQDDPLRGSTVTISNTFERDDDGEEPFGESATATVGALIEFFPYGPYNVDISSTEITFAWDSDSRWDSFERVLEADFFDRYYIDLEGVTIDDVSADSSANLVPNVTILDDNSLVVEFTEGMEVGDGQIARIAIDVESAAVAADDEDDEDADGDDADGDDADGDDADDADDAGDADDDDADDADDAGADDSASSSSTSGSSGGDLPRTGLDAELLGASAIGLLTIGSAFVVARRRAARDALAA